MCMFVCGTVYHYVHPCLALCLLATNGLAVASQVPLSPFTSLCQPPHSGHFQHSHPLWMAVILAKLYTHMAGSQPLKPHCNITQQSFNESLTRQHCIKATRLLLCSENIQPGSWFITPLLLWHHLHVEERKYYRPQLTSACWVSPRNLRT